MLFQFSALAQSNAEKLENMCQEAENLIETNPKLAAKKADDFLVFAKKTFQPTDTNLAIAHLSYALIQANAQNALDFCVEHVDKAIKILEKHKNTNPKLYNNSFYYKGSVYFTFGDYENASVFQSIALDDALNNEYYSVNEKVIFLANLVEINNKAGKVDENKKWIESAELIIKSNIENLDKNLYLGFLNVKSNHYASFGDYETSQTILMNSVNFAEKNELTTEIAYFEALNNLSINAFEMNEIDIAFRYAQKLLSELQQLNFTESNLYFGALNVLGVIFSEKGDLKKSDSCQALALQKRLETYGENHPSYWNSLSNYAVYLMKVGDANKADLIFKKVMKLSEKNNATDTEAFSNLLNNYTVFLLSKDVEKFDEAKKTIENNLKRVEKRYGKSHAKYWDSYNLLSTVYIAKKDFTSAEKVLLEHLRFLESQKSKNWIDWCLANNNLAEFYVNQLFDFKSALKFNQMAETEFLKVYDQRHPIYINFLGTRLQIFDKSSQVKEGVEVSKRLLSLVDEHVLNTFSHLSDRQKVGFYQDNYDYYRYFFQFAGKHLSQYPELKAIFANASLRAKGFTLKHSRQIRKMISLSGNQSLLRLFNQWQVKKEELVKLKNMSLAERKSLGKDLNVVSNEIENLERSISKESDEFRKLWKQEITWESAKKNLMPDEVLVQMVKTNVFAEKWTDTVVYFAVIIKHNAVEPEVVEVARGHKFDKKQLGYYRNSIDLKKTNSYTYKTLWAKIDSAIGNINKVFFMPDGVYHKINPSTLQKNDGSFLLQQKMIFLITDPILNRNQKTKFKKTAVLIGNPDFDYNIFKETFAQLKTPKSTEKELETALRSGVGSVQKLEGTKIEIEKIDRLLSAKGFETKVLAEKNAQEVKLKQFMKSSIIHIATHGYFDVSEKDSLELVSGSDYFASGLLLAGSNYSLNRAPVHGFPQDGVVSAYEILNFDLSQTELVVLSACETGLGVEVNGNGVFGLQRAFSIAGARNIIMSLWKVSDEATSELMSVFYTYYITSENIKESFVKAQLKLKDKYPEPYFWGAFVLLTNE